MAAKCLIRLLCLIVGYKPSFDDKISNFEFLIIRKPLTFLTSTQAREKIQNAILKDKKNLLIMYTYYDLESFEVLYNFLKPFNIIPSEIKIIDHKTNLKNKNVVVFHKKNKCFMHDTLFDGVTKLVISDPRHLTVEPPAKKQHGETMQLPWHKLSARSKESCGMRIALETTNSATLDAIWMNGGDS